MLIHAGKCIEDGAFSHVGVAGYGDYPVIRALPTTIFETEASGAVAADKVGTTLQLNETADGVTTTANGPFTVTWADGGTLVRGYFEPAAASV